MADQHEVDLDSIIDRLLEVRGSRPGKQVQLLEAEIRYLCTKAREIFISQPILLELEAPIKVSHLVLFGVGLVCHRSTSQRLTNPHGALRSAAISTVSTMICSGSLSMEGSRPRQTTSSLGTMSIAASSHWRPSACSSRTKSSIRRTSSS